MCLTGYSCTEGCLPPYQNHRCLPTCALHKCNTPLTIALTCGDPWPGSCSDTHCCPPCSVATAHECHHHIDGCGWSATASGGVCKPCVTFTGSSDCHAASCAWEAATGRCLPCATRADAVACSTVGCGWDATTKKCLSCGNFDGGAGSCVSASCGWQAATGGCEPCTTLAQDVCTAAGCSWSATHDGCHACGARATGGECVTSHGCSWTPTPGRCGSCAAYQGAADCAAAGCGWSGTLTCGGCDLYKTKGDCMNVPGCGWDGGECVGCSVFTDPQQCYSRVGCGWDAAAPSCASCAVLSGRAQCTAAGCGYSAATGGCNACQHADHQGVMECIGAGCGWRKKRGSCEPCTTIDQVIECTETTPGCTMSRNGCVSCAIFGTQADCYAHTCSYSASGVCEWKHPETPAPETIVPATFTPLTPLPATPIPVTFVPQTPSPNIISTFVPPTPLPAVGSPEEVDIARAAALGEEGEGEGKNWIWLVIVLLLLLLCCILAYIWWRRRQKVSFHDDVVQKKPMFELDETTALCTPPGSSPSPPAEREGTRLSYNEDGLSDDDEAALLSGIGEFEELRTASHPVDDLVGGTAAARSPTRQALRRTRPHRDSLFRTRSGSLTGVGPARAARSAPRSGGHSMSAPPTRRRSRASLVGISGSEWSPDDDEPNQAVDRSTPTPRRGSLWVPDDDEPNAAVDTRATKLRSARLYTPASSRAIERRRAPIEELIGSPRAGRRQSMPALDQRKQAPAPQLFQPEPLSPVARRLSGSDEPQHLSPRRRIRAAITAANAAALLSRSLVQHGGSEPSGDDDDLISRTLMLPRIDTEGDSGDAADDPIAQTMMLPETVATSPRVRVARAFIPPSASMHTGTPRLRRNPGFREGPKTKSSGQLMTQSSAASMQRRRSRWQGGPESPASPAVARPPQQQQRRRESADDSPPQSPAAPDVSMEGIPRFRTAFPAPPLTETGRPLLRTTTVGAAPRSQGHSKGRRARLARASPSTPAQPMAASTSSPDDPAAAALRLMRARTAVMSPRSAQLAAAAAAEGSRGARGAPPPPAPSEPTAATEPSEVAAAAAGAGEAAAAAAPAEPAAAPPEPPPPAPKAPAPPKPPPKPPAAPAPPKPPPRPPPKPPGGAQANSDGNVSV